MSMGEIFVVLLVSLLVFGGRLPDAARKLGATLSEFKRGMREEMRKVEEGIRPDAPPPAWRPPPAPPKEPAPSEPSPPGP